MEQEYVPKEIIIEDEIEDSFILSEWLSSKKRSKGNYKSTSKRRKEKFNWNGKKKCNRIPGEIFWYE